MALLHPNRLRVIIYLRVSTDEQAREGHSLEAQLKVCKAFAEQRNWIVVATYLDPEDGLAEVPQPRPAPENGQRKPRASASGKNDKRPGFQRMIADVRAGRADVVLTHKLDRFSRSIADVLLYMREFNRLGVAYTSATEQFDFTTPIGKVMLTLLAAFAEWYLDNLSVETKKGKRARAEKGYWNGDLSFGYRLSPDGLHAEPDPATAPGVVLAFTEYAKSAYTDLDIARILNKAGYRSQGKRGSLPFSKDTIRAVLQNRFYIGHVTYKGEVHPGQHPPLISRDVFDKAQAIRRRQSLAPRRANPHTRIYPLSGLIFCAECKRALRGQALLSGHRYYRDVDHHYAGNCTNQTLTRADHLENSVAAILMGIQLPPAWQAQISGRLDTGRDAAYVDGRRARAESKIARANELYYEGLTDRKERDRASQEAQAEIDVLKPVPAPALLTMSGLLADLPRVWKLATDGERKTLLQAMLERVYVRGLEIVALQPRAELYALLQQVVYCGPDEIRVPNRLLHISTERKPVIVIPPATPPSRLGQWLPA